MGGVGYIIDRGSGIMAIIPGSQHINERHEFPAPGHQKFSNVTVVGNVVVGFVWGKLQVEVGILELAGFPPQGALSKATRVGWGVACIPRAWVGRERGQTTGNQTVTLATTLKNRPIQQSSCSHCRSQ